MHGCSLSGVVVEALLASASEEIRGRARKHFWRMKGWLQVSAYLLTEVGRYSESVSSFRGELMLQWISVERWLWWAAGCWLEVPVA